MAIVRSYLADAEREFVDGDIDEIYRVRRIMPVVDFQGASGRDVDSRVLIAHHRLSVFAFEFQEFDVHPNPMTWHLFLVSPSVDLVNLRAARNRLRPLRLRMRYTPASEKVGAIARHIPDDTDWSRTVGFAQVQQLLDDLRRYSFGGILRNCISIIFPALEAQEKGCLVSSYIIYSLNSPVAQSL